MTWVSAIYAKRNLVEPDQRPAVGWLVSVSVVAVVAFAVFGRNPLLLMNAALLLNIAAQFFGPKPKPRPQRPAYSSPTAEWVIGALCSFFIFGIVIVAMNGGLDDFIKALLAIRLPQAWIADSSLLEIAGAWIQQYNVQIFGLAALVFLPVFNIAKVTVEKTSSRWLWPTLTCIAALTGYYIRQHGFAF